jgi:signal transduction histidine kinase/CheY-like chemotaxis protein
MKRFNFAVFFAIFAVVMSGVMLSAIISFSSMVRISRGVIDEAVPQRQLFLLGGLVAEIQNAENSIRGYRLTRETKWMEEFFTSSVNCSDKLSELRDLSEGDEAKLSDINSLSGLVQEKLEKLESFSQLPDRTSVVSELEGISSRFDHEADTSAAETRTRGFIRSLFTRDRQSTDRLDSLQVQLVAEVEQIRQRQSLRLRSIDATEFDYLEQISAIGKEIESLIASLRLDALAMVEEALEERERQQIASGRKIRQFSLAAGLFLLLGGFAVFSYLKTRRKYELALTEAKKNAELYSSMQERFIANMSHEVRTPLHAIAGFTDQFVRSGKENREEYLELTNAAMKHLLQVVDDILDYSKLVAGKMKLKMEPFSPVQEAETVTGIFRRELDSKGLELSVENALSDGIVLVGDALRYRQVLMNLVSNSLKFSPGGTIRIRIYREEDLRQGSDDLRQAGGYRRMEGGDHRHAFSTEVSDEGLGIKKEELEKVFMPFEQAENTASGTYRGTGLGLAITREIIEQQGGSITMESKPGEGTRVVFSLPYLESGPLSDKKPKEESLDLSFLDGLRVLVADDEKWNSRLVESMLGKHGAAMTVVEDGNAALLELQQDDYDVALLDLRMPGKSGLEVARLAREEEKNKSIPVVSLTAQVIGDNEKQDYTKYFSAFLIKPFTEEQLVTLLREVLMVSGGPGTGRPGTKPVRGTL